MANCERHEGRSPQDSQWDDPPVLRGRWLRRDLGPLRATEPSAGGEAAGGALLQLEPAGRYNRNVRRTGWNRNTISNHQESESQFDDSMTDMTVASILVSLAVLHAISFSMTAVQVGRRGLPCGCHTGCLSSTLGPWGWRGDGIIDMSKR